MLDSIAKDIAATVKESVQAGVKALSDKIELRLKALEDSLAALPVPKDGIDGKSITVEDIMPMLKKMIEEIELPKPEKGDKGDSVTLEEIKPVIDEAVSAAVAEIPKPKDGKDGADAPPVDMAEVQTMVDTAVATAVAAVEIPPAKDGVDGKNGLDIEIESNIDEGKSYPKNTYAKHRGGLWKSFKKTTGMNGWECIVEGLHKTLVNKIDERTFCIVNENSSGAVTKAEVKIPAQIYKGVWKEGDYSEGDTVTLSGSQWVCVEDKTKSRPGTSSSGWKLSVKAGRDAKIKLKPEEEK